MSKKTVDYDALEARLIDPSGAPAAADVSTGSAAAKAGRELLLREYGSEEAIERAMVRPGRPRVGGRHGPSPTVRARITHDEHAAMQRLAAETGRTQSELVREAVHRLLRDNKLVG